MYVTKDKNGNNFRWSKKGKNRECEVRDYGCIVRKCFLPEDCGTVDPKTQQKHIRGMCKGLFDGTCPEESMLNNRILNSRISNSGFNSRY